jgi:hypothetical protein
VFKPTAVDLQRFVVAAWFACIDRVVGSLSMGLFVFSGGSLRCIDMFGSIGFVVLFSEK